MRQLITTKEPIKLEVEFSSYGDDQTDVYVDSIHYASIAHLGEDDADLDAIKQWVESTYYDGDYKSDAYCAGRYGAENFKKKEEEDESYNGWKNYETWNVALWIGNNERYYQIAKASETYDNFQDEARVYCSMTPDRVKWDDPRLDIDRLDELIAEMKEEN